MGSIAMSKLFWLMRHCRKWNDNETKMANIPLFLVREAFLVWNELSDLDKKGPDNVKGALSAVFGLTPAPAYERFMHRSLSRIDESVDSKKGLLNVSGHTLDACRQDRKIYRWTA